jgi:hypothetical protein
MGTIDNTIEADTCRSIWVPYSFSHFGLKEGIRLPYSARTVRVTTKNKTARSNLVARRRIRRGSKHLGPLSYVSRSYSSVDLVFTFEFLIAEVTELLC